jgi:hypothetical protein
MLFYKTKKKIKKKEVNLSYLTRRSNFEKFLKIFSTNQIVKDEIQKKNIKNDRKNKKAILSKKKLSARTGEFTKPMSKIMKSR